MKLEDQVCSLELAKKLKDLNVRQESAFYWVEIIPGENPNTWPGHEKPTRRFELMNHFPFGLYENGIYQGEEKYYSAFTVSELGEMLPPDTDSGKGHSGKFYCFTCDSEDGDTWHYDRASEMGKDFEPHCETDENEANARAAMLAHLIEKGIVKP